MDNPKLISIDVDDATVRQLIVEHIQEHLKTVENDPLFYTLDDLQRMTGMSKGFIDKTFFHDSRFEQIRRKVGRKWLFPVKETRAFLQEWIKEQPHH